MRKYLMILFIAVSILTANSQNVRTVHLDGQPLEEALGDDIFNIDSLVVTGKIMKDDYKNGLSKALYLGRVRGVDLSGCETENGKMYYLSANKDGHPVHPENLRYFRVHKNTEDIEQTFRFTTLCDFHLPATLRTIGDRAFLRSTIVDDLWIPEGVDSIAPYAFFNAKMPNNVYLPASLRVMGTLAFSEDEKYIGDVNLWCQWTNVPDLEDKLYGIGPFAEVFSRWTIHVPVSSKQSYLDNEYFREFEKIVEYDPAVLAGIQRAGVADKPSAAPLAIYTISGQYVGTDFNSLPSGVYVMRGKKVVK